MSSIFHNFNANTADALNLLSVLVGNADGVYNIFDLWTPHKTLQ